MRIVCVIAFVLVRAFSAAGAVVEIAAPAAPNAAQPFVSPSKDGVLLSWLEPVGKSDRVALRFARYRGGKWSPPRTIVERNDLFVNWADFPSIVEDANGVLFAHWLQKSGGTTYAYDVRIATSRDGGKTWSTPFLLNRDGKQNEHGFVTLAPLANGGVAATWLDGRNMQEGKEEGDMTLRSATVAPNGVIGADVQLDTRTCECCTTGMAMTPSGPVIAYRDRSPDEVRDIAIVRAARTGWTKPQIIRKDGWKVAGCPVNGPQVSASGRNVAVGWFTAANDQQQVYVAFSRDAGATFGTAIRIDDGKPIGRVDVAMLDADRAFATWIEQTAGGAEIRGRVVSRKLSRDSAIKLADSSAARAAGFPRITLLGRDVIVAWTDQTATQKRIRIARVTF